MKRKTVSIFVILVMVTSLFAACDSGTGKILAYKLLEDDTYEVSISVDPLDVRGRVNIPPKYKGEAVTAIANGAFNGCKNLTGITIPQSIQSIGANAFYNTGIWNESKANGVVYLGNWLIGYKGNSNQGNDALTGLIIEPGTKGIAEGALSSCRKLESIEIPNSVTFIGGSAFYECASLTSITIPDSVTCINSRTFYSCTSLASITIPDSVEFIGNYAFALCRSLASITIPDSVEFIGDNAFDSCVSLTSITIPDSVEFIGDNAFDSCRSLASITIPDSVTSIGSRAFSSCTSLTSITIPDSVTSIGSEAFRYCHSLESIIIPESVTSIGEEAFEVPHTYGEEEKLTIYVGASSKPAGWADSWLDGQNYKEAYTIVWNYK